MFLEVWPILSFFPHFLYILPIDIRVHTIGLSPEAKDLWKDLYASFGKDKAGYVELITCRSEAITRRLAMVYAILDKQVLVTAEHLKAAHAVWTYCEKSADYLFGSAAHTHQDRILKAIQSHPEGLTLTELHKVFQGHLLSKDLQKELQELEQHKIIKRVKQVTGNRSVEKWTLNHEH